MNNRETKTIKTATGIEIILNAYMTGGEVMDLESTIASGASMSLEGGKSSMSMKPADAIASRLKKIIEMMIVSINGKTEKSEVWTEVRALRSNEYTELMKEIDAIVEGVSPEDAKK
jgi:hypothetical protein